MVMINQKCNGRPSKSNVPEPNEEAITYGVNRLHISAALNSLSQASKCIKNENQNIDGRDAGGNSPLHYAARYNNVTMINWLLENGANVHVQNNHGQNALHYAYQAYALDAVEALRDNGASTKVRDVHGVVPAATRRLRTKKNAQIPLLSGLDELTR